MPKSKQMPLQDMFWAISERGLYQISEIGEQILARAKLDHSWDDEPDNDDEEVDPSPLIDRVGKIGVINIKGPLVNTDSFWNELFGLVSYGSIKKALIEAAADDGIETIVLDINSPGGAAMGVQEVSDLISTIDSTLKPVHAYTDGSMCSGAYWLGCSARTVSSSQLAEIGSIGVVMNHREYTEALAKAGIKAKVIRAGKYKQMGNPNEPLSDEGLAELQRMVDGIYKIFVEHVAESRGKSYDFTDQHMAQGRVYLPEHAKEVGLVDKITGFEALLVDLSSKNVDNKAISFQNNGIGVTMSKNNKKTLISAIEQTLLASGKITVDDLGGNQATEAEVAAAAEAAAKVEAEAEAKAKAEADGGDAQADADADAGTSADASADADADADANIDADAADDAPVAKADTGAIDLLKAQVAERDEQIIESRIQIRELQKQLDELKASSDGLKDIAVKSINAMQVALGGRATDYATSSATDVLAAHVAVSEDFTKNFPVGGVAAVEQDTKQATKSHAMSSIEAARLRATRF